MIAIEIAGRNPPDLTGVISMEGWTHHRVQQDAFGGDVNPTLTPELLEQRAAAHARVIDKLSKEEQDAFAAIWKTWDGQRILETIAVPVLEIWGDRGRPRPSRALLRIPECPNIQLVWIANASPSYLLERPADIANAITDGGQVLVLPTLEPIEFNARAYRPYAKFSHANEKAFPGYYAVQLPGVLAELTATQRVGVHRYTFDLNTTPYLIIDISSAMGGRRGDEATVSVNPDIGEFEGSVRTFGTFASRYDGIKVYFVGCVDCPIVNHTLWRDVETRINTRRGSGQSVGVKLALNPSNKPVTLRIAISHVSIENAKENLDMETQGKDFDTILADAKARWEEKLGLIPIEGGSDAQRTVFYSALYRSFQMPTLFTDVNNEDLGFDGAVHTADDFRYFTDMSLWDTFRTVHPLYNLIAAGG